jgi:hypothetical protein
MISSQADMEELVTVNHDRLLNHPMYATVFEDIAADAQIKLSSPSLRIHSTSPQVHKAKSSRSTAPPKPKKSLQTSFPTLDWEAIAQQMKLLSLVERNNNLITIINSFCDTFDDITRQCDPITQGKVDIRVLTQLVEQMDHYADNMSAASPPQLRQKIFESHSIYKLQECMRAICTAIAKHNQVEVGPSLNLVAKRSLQERLHAVDTILFSAFWNRGTEWASEINKVIPYLQST